LRFDVIDFRDFIEALFIGTGPYGRDSDRGCSGRMNGWRDGTNVRILVDDSVPDDARQHAESLSSFVREMSNGAIGASVQRIAVYRAPERGEIQVTTPPRRSCASGAAGCTIYDRFEDPYTVAASVVVVPPSNPMQHELGHALFGLCHFRFPTGDDLSSNVNNMSIMGSGTSFGRPSEADVLALRAVYAAGLRPGAGRGAFVVAGLVRP
jgi:hypothetical protein